MEHVNALMNTEERKTRRDLSFLPYFTNFGKYIDPLSPRMKFFITSTIVLGIIKIMCDVV